MKINDLKSVYGRHPHCWSGPNDAAPFRASGSSVSSDRLQMNDRRSRSVSGHGAGLATGVPQLALGILQRLDLGRKRGTRARGMPTGPPVLGFRANPLWRAAARKNATRPPHSAAARRLSNRASTASRSAGRSGFAAW